MSLPLYLDEKRYSYHVLASYPLVFADYQQTDPSTDFENRVQQLYTDAYGYLKQQQYDRALDAFRQLQNLILTTVHPTLPVTSYIDPEFIAPLDPQLLDVFAAKI